MNREFYDFDNRITRALMMWAESHPHPDEPAIAIADGRTLTPVELAHEVAERTEFGRKQLEVFRYLAEVDDELDPEDVVELAAGNAAIA